ATSRTATWTADNIAPILTATGNNTPLGCNPTGAAIDAALGSATASDACGTPTVTSSDGAVGTNGCILSQTRTWTAVDAFGNSSSSSRTATRTADNIPPMPPSTGNNTPLGCNPTGAAIDAALGSATASDACGAVSLTVTTGAVSGSCVQSQTRRWTATDACGNTATTSRTVSWSFNTTPPVITVNQTPLPAGCNPSSAAIDAALGSATASDACGTVSLTVTTGAVSGSCVQSQTRTWTATDACGNTATTSRTVSWSFNTTPPVITVNQ